MEEISNHSSKHGSESSEKSIELPEKILVHKSEQPKKFDDENTDSNDKIDINEYKIPLYDEPKKEKDTCTPTTVGDH